jgi:hypothetical protein
MYNYSGTAALWQGLSENPVTFLTHTPVKGAVNFALETVPAIMYHGNNFDRG